ncbi:MAG: isovaleryl-CoA dehydrogenase [Acidimicrobiia bacterium]|nr:MAG: isovaleryl-CoA dehydrogenase [Acidimicrobiia bacterium]
MEGRNFDLNAEDRLILNEADRFAREQLAPLARRMDDEEWWPEDLFPMLGRHGQLGLTIPTEFGGQGMDLFQAALVGQAYSRWNHAAALSIGAHDNLCANNIYRNGSDRQRRQYLPDLCSGTKVGALGLTEPGAGSDALGSMATTAVRDGDVYVLNGSKTFITNGPIADILLVYAKTDPAAGAHGISAFIVESSFPGFRVAQKLTKMGFRGSQTGELVFQDCIVPAENLLGDENKGVAITMSGLDIERIYLAAGAVGMAERCLDLAVDYANSREQFGRPIADFQMIQSKLAEMYASLEAMRTFAYRALMAARDLEIGEGGRGNIHKLAAAVVLFGGQQLVKIADDALQIHGGSGLMWESEINRIYRAVKLYEIGAGTTEVRKLIISEELTNEWRAANR